MEDEKPSDSGTEDAEPFNALHISTDISVQTWEDSTLVCLDDGSILTLLQNVPVHNPAGEVIDFMKKPIAYYKIHADRHPGVARMFMRQCLLWAANYGEEGLLENEAEALQNIITEATDEYANLRKDRLEQEASSGDDEPRS